MHAPAKTTTAASVSLEQMLAAREQRATRQSATRARFNKPLVSMTVVMPGPVKDGPLPRRVLTAALEELDALTSSRNWPVLLREVFLQSTGPEAIYVIDVEPKVLKSATVELEDQHSLGRLWDLDVIAPGPRLLSRKHLGVSPRRCLMCERPAFECGRSRRHSVEDLLRAIQRIVSEYDSVQTHRHNALLGWSPGVHRARTVSRIAGYAHRAIITELMLTPKPGLVDRRNSGAHHDMNLPTFLASVRAVAPWWPRFIEIGYAFAHVPACDFLPLARRAGVLCERSMLQATRGVNTHKGAIFSLGLLCCAAGRLLARRVGLNRERICTEVGNICVGLVDRELSGTHTTNTAGERVFRRHGRTGARGEAASGYALVRTIALPIYDGLLLRGISGDVALLQVLLHLLAVNGDTNLISRGGLAGLNHVREYAAKLLAEGGALAPDGVKKLEAFDHDLIGRHLSPGGSADLLGVAWFLAQFPGSHQGVETP
jgi:triphosphoribosyl-dephospho-CoA synthase